MRACSYASYAHFQTSAVRELSDWLIESTGGEMRKVYLYCSGEILSLFFLFFFFSLFPLVLVLC